LKIFEEGNKWKIGFITGLVLIPFAFFNLLPEVMIWDFKLTFFDNESIYNKNLTMVGFLLGGICLGVGAKLANGCTSGHCICGVPRFSKRSMIFTPVFMSSAMIIATMRNYFQIMTDSFNLG